MTPEDRFAGRIQAGGHHVVRRRPEEVAVHIVLASPDYLDRFADVLRKPHGFQNVIAKASAESTTQQCVVDFYFFDRNTQQLRDLALDDQGQLAPPTSYDVAGWFAGGVLPGEAGPAVIAGHVDSAAGPGVFYRLHELKTGDAVDVLRGGTWVRFRVTTTEQYAKDRFPSERVYRPTPDAELRLITCGGDFDRGRLSYRDNIVVYAVIE